MSPKCYNERGRICLSRNRTTTRHPCQALTRFHCVPARTGRAQTSRRPSYLVRAPPPHLRHGTVPPHICGRPITHCATLLKSAVRIQIGYYLHMHHITLALGPSVRCFLHHKVRFSRNPFVKSVGRCGRGFSVFLSVQSAIISIISLFSNNIAMNMRR